MGKRKIEYDNQGPREGNPHGLTLLDPRIRGNNQFLSRAELPATLTVEPVGSISVSAH